MRRTAVLFPLLLLAFAAAPVAAQEEPDFDPATEAHRAGRWSMQFEVGPDFDLTNFDGAGLAMTKNTSASSAWRLGVSLSARSFDNESALSINSGLNASGNNNDFSATIDLLRLKRFQPSHRVGLELGLGPVVSYGHSSADNVQTDDPIQFKVEQHGHSAFLGLTTRLGAEVMLAHSVGVHAHYGLEAGYTRRRITTSSTSGPISGAPTYSQSAETESDRWSLTPGGVLFGLSVYL